MGNWMMKRMIWWQKAPTQDTWGFFNKRHVGPPNGGTNIHIRAVWVSNSLVEEWRKLCVKIISKSCENRVKMSTFYSYHRECLPLLFAFKIAATWRTSFHCRDLMCMANCKVLLGVPLFGWKVNSVTCCWQTLRHRTRRNALNTQIASSGQ